MEADFEAPNDGFADDDLLSPNDVAGAFFFFLKYIKIFAV